MKEGLELKADNIVYLMEEITIKEEAVWLKEEKCDDDEASAVEDPLEDIVIKTEPIKVEAVEISQDVGVDLNNRGRNSDGTFVDLGDCHDDSLSSLDVTGEGKSTIGQPSSINSNQREKGRGPKL
ncbi:uncharacterized protein [Anabrus simplex]|uniref:uncharacterized protein isoform X3 n=1 Tax=Anabrus simplex TaxID=316456 RepID=UPI0035A2AE18